MESFVVDIFVRINRLAFPPTQEITIRGSG